MPKYLAVVRLDARERVFVIRSPDFPNLEQRCDDFARVFKMAEEVIRVEVGKLKAERMSLPPPTPIKSLKAKDEYRQCFFVPVAAGDKSDPAD